MRNPSIPDNSEEISCALQGTQQSELDQEQKEYETAKLLMRKIIAQAKSERYVFAGIDESSSLSGAVPSTLLISGAPKLTFDQYQAFIRTRNAIANRQLFPTVLQYTLPENHSSKWDPSSHQSLSFLTLTSNIPAANHQENTTTHLSDPGHAYSYRTFLLNKAAESDSGMHITDASFESQEAQEFLAPPNKIQTA